MVVVTYTDNRSWIFHDASIFVIQDTSYIGNHMEDLNEAFGGDSI